MRPVHLREEPFPPAVTASVSVAVRAALSTVSHDGEFSAVAVGMEGAGALEAGAGRGAVSAWEAWPRPAQPTRAMSAARAGAGALIPGILIIGRGALAPGWSRL